MMTLKELDFNRYIIVEVEETINSDDTQGYLHCSHIRIHDGEQNQLAGQFKRYTHMRCNEKTAQPVAVITFDDIITDELGLEKQDIDQLYHQNGASYDFVHTVTL